jgi:hypothetical protein
MTMTPDAFGALKSCRPVSSHAHACMSVIQRPPTVASAITCGVTSGAWPSAPARLFAVLCCAPRD